MTLLRRWWPVILAAVAVGAGVVYINHLRGRVSEADRERDVARLEAAGANAAHEVTKRELGKEVDRLAGKNAGLEAEIKKIRDALPGATPLAAAEGSTGAVPLLTKPSVPGLTVPDPCVLRPTDRIDIRVAGVVLQGDSGAVAVAATAQAWKVGEPPVLLAEGPLKLDVKSKAQTELPGWAAGAVLVGGRTGYWVGPVLSPPPLRLWGLEASLLVGAGAGGGGEWGGLVGGLLRW